MKKSTKQLNRVFFNPSEFDVYHTKEEIKMYKTGYEWGQYALENGGLQSFNPEIAYRQFITRTLQNNFYSSAELNYFDFLKGQQDALEDYDSQSKIGKQFSSENPIILDLTAILVTLKLHKSIDNYLIPYHILDRFFYNSILFNDEIYINFLLQILERMKFITIIETNYFLTPLGLELLKINVIKRDIRLFEFLKTFTPKYPIIQKSSLLKNPKC